MPQNITKMHAKKGQFMHLSTPPGFAFARRRAIKEGKPMKRFENGKIKPKRFKQSIQHPHLR